MSTSPTNSVSVEGNTPIVQQAPLLRSLSNTSNKDTQKLCTHCRSSRNKEFIIEVIPSNPFMKGNLSELQQLISTKLEDKAGCHLFTKPTMAEPNSPQEDSLERRYWWDGLFAKSEISPFMHMWSVLLGLENLFCSAPEKKLCNCLELCYSAMSQSMKENYRCNTIQLRTGSTTIHNTGLVWSPCSLAFALELSLAWARLLIEQQQQQNRSGQVTGEKEAVPSNLAVESFGVLQNWVDFILTGKLGPKATSSGQTEPESSSFREKPERSNPSKDGPADPVPNRFTIVLVSDRAEPPTADAAAAGDWQMLANAWKRVVRDRLESEPGRAVQFSLADVGNADSADFDSLVEKLLSWCL